MVVDLIDRLKVIAEKEGIPESDLILDEAEFFIREHEGHGVYQLRLDYGGDILESIEIECFATEVDESECLHTNSECVEESYSIIYSRRPVDEIKYQRERRERILGGK